MLNTDNAAEVAAVVRLAALKCEGCYGDELLMRNAEGDAPCIHCHNDQNQPTGRRFPGLVEHCPAMSHTWIYTSVAPRTPCSKRLCDGTGWLAVPPAEALYYLIGQEGFLDLFRSIVSGSYCAEWNEKKGIQSTPLLALVAAIEASCG